MLTDAGDCANAPVKARATKPTAQPTKRNDIFIINDPFRKGSRREISWIYENDRLVVFESPCECRDAYGKTLLGRNEILRRQENFTCVRIFYCGSRRKTGHFDVTAIWCE